MIFRWDTFYLFSHQLLEDFLNYRHIVDYAVSQQIARFHCKISYRWCFSVFSQTSNSVGLIFFKNINDIMILLHTKFWKNPICILKFVIKITFRSIPMCCEIFVYAPKYLYMSVLQQIRISLQNICRCIFWACHTFCSVYSMLERGTFPF